MKKETYSIKLSIWSEPNQMGNMSVYYFTRFNSCGTPLFGGIAHENKKVWDTLSGVNKCLKNVEYYFKRNVTFMDYKFEIVTNNYMEQFVIVTINTTKVGYYVFIKFAENCPQFTGNQFLCDYRVYNSKSVAERTANRVRKYFKGNDNIITKVLSVQEWNNVQDCAQMEEFMLNN